MQIELSIDHTVHYPQGLTVVVSELCDLLVDISHNPSLVAYLPMFSVSDLPKASSFLTQFAELLYMRHQISSENVIFSSSLLATSLSSAVAYLYNEYQMDAHTSHTDEQKSIEILISPMG